MVAKKKPKRKLKSENVEHETCVFFEGDFGATSSPKCPLEHRDSLQQSLQLTQLISEEFEREKEKLLEELNGVKELIKTQITLFRMKLGLQAQNSILERWDVNQHDLENYIRETTTIKEDRGLTHSSREPEMSDKKPEETSDLLKMFIGKRRSLSVPPQKAAKTQGNSIATSVTDAEGFKIPKVIPMGSSHKYVERTPMSWKPKQCGYKNIAVVTPGPNIRAPISVMRRPAAGETAISLDGSPLLVSSDVFASTMPNITVPLHKDKVISIFPRDGFDLDDMPVLDYKTKHQLNRLREYLNAIVLKE